MCDSCIIVHSKLPSLKDHNIVTVRAAPGETPGRGLLGGRIQSRRNVNVSLEDDKYFPVITGCVFMSNGYLVACDYYNSNIKLLDSSLSLQDSLKLPSESAPYILSVIDNNTVIVTIPHQKQLQYIQVFPQLKLGYVIQLYKKCWGVDGSVQEIYVSCHKNPGDGEVRVLDRQGNLKRRLGIREDGSYLFSAPEHITVSSARDKIFISDLFGHTVTCMKVDGSIVYQNKDADLKSPTDLNLMTKTTSWSVVTTPTKYL